MIKYCLKAFLVSLALASHTEAATIITSGDQLTGARGVEVGSLSFDVDIVDGSCVSVFNGCDEPSDFFITDPDLGIDLMRALRDQVFLDGPDGAFDSDPNLTLGCNSRINRCGVFSPVADLILGPGSVAAVNVFNDFDDRRDIITQGTLNPFTDSDGLTWAVFSQRSVSEIPLPSSIALLLSTLLFPLFLRRRSNRKVANP